MSESGDMVFSVNGLVAISCALESQIEECEDYLTDPTLTLDVKVHLNQLIQHSKSATARLNSIFKEIGINPRKN